MRILGVEQKWSKLRHGKFTTFRFERKDKDWEVDEEVRVVYKPRSKDREMLGIAMIIDKEHRQFSAARPDEGITIGEAQADGFSGYPDMAVWFFKRYGKRIIDEPINKLTLKWMCKFTQF